MQKYCEYCISVKLFGVKYNHVNKIKIKYNCTYEPLVDQIRVQYLRWGLLSLLVIWRDENRFVQHNWNQVISISSLETLKLHMNTAILSFNLLLVQSNSLKAHCMEAHAWCKVIKYSNTFHVISSHCKSYSVNSGRQIERVNAAARLTRLTS